MLESTRASKSLLPSPFIAIVIHRAGLTPLGANVNGLCCARGYCSCATLFGRPVDRGFDSNEEPRGYPGARTICALGHAIFFFEPHLRFVIGWLGLSSYGSY